MVNYFSKVGAVGLHTISHMTSAISTEETFYNELSKEKENLRILAEVNNIKGSRAPFLQPNQGYFNVLRKLGLLYDSSMMNGFSEDPAKKIPYWPFTLNFGVPEPRLCNIYDPASCPTSVHEGLWEVPLVSFTSDSPLFLMDYVVDDDYNTVMENMKANFLETYNTNKAPRGFYVHHRYLSNNGDFDSLQVTRAKFIQEFYTWLSGFPDVVFATEDQVIDWIKNPKTISQIKADPKYACQTYLSSPENACEAGIKECHHYLSISLFIYFFFTSKLINKLHNLFLCSSTLQLKILFFYFIMKKYTLFSFFKFILDEPYDPLVVCGNKCPQPMPDENTIWSFLPVNSEVMRWGGEVRIEEDENWTTGGCFSLYSLHKNEGKIAQSHVLTLSIPRNKGVITAMWGHVQYDVSRGKTIQTFRQKGFKIEFIIFF